MRACNLLEGAAGKNDQAQAALLEILAMPETASSALSTEMRTLLGAVADARLPLVDAALYLGSLDRDLQSLLRDPASLNQGVIDSLQAGVTGLVANAKLARGAARSLEGPWGPWYRAVKLSNIYGFIGKLEALFTCGGSWATTPSSEAPARRITASR